MNQIADSITEFGFTNPVLIDPDANIIAGHGRLRAARQLGLAEVPTITLTNLSDEQIRLLRLAQSRARKLPTLTHKIAVATCGKLWSGYALPAFPHAPPMADFCAAVDSQLGFRAFHGYRHGDHEIGIANIAYNIARYI